MVRLTVAAVFALPVAISMQINHRESNMQVPTMHVCSEAELRAGKTAGTGCNFDWERIWTTDKCGKGSVRTVAGAANINKKKAEPPQCRRTTKKVAIRCCPDDGPKVKMNKYNRKCRFGTFRQAVAICAAAGAGEEPAPDFEKVQGGMTWKCKKKQLGRAKNPAECAKRTQNNPVCITGQFEFHRRYCKCVTQAPCVKSKGGRGFATYKFDTGGVQIHNTDSRWGCARRGVGSKKGFGHADEQACAGAVREDPRCTTGQFDYNQNYNGQCKCVVAKNTCVKVTGLRNYNTYSITPWDAPPPPATTTTTPGTTTTTTTICVAGAIDDSDICNHKTCVDDGSAWMTVQEKCPEEVCPAGEAYAAIEGECCKQCVFEACAEEGEVGTDVCPAGCVHVEDEDECKLAATAWKKDFDDGAIPEGSPRPTGCFRNKNYLIKFNANNPSGGMRNKWPICKKDF